MADEKPVKVEIVNPPSGDNPWHTKAAYLEDRRQDRNRYRWNVAVALASIVSTVATACIAIVTILHNSN